MNIRVHSETCFIKTITTLLPLIYLTLNLLTSAASSAMLSLLRWVI